MPPTPLPRDAADAAGLGWKETACDRASPFTGFMAPTATASWYDVTGSFAADAGFELEAVSRRLSEHISRLRVASSKSM